jgi:hypothetical protein
MRKIQCKRHVVVGLVGRLANHHSLIRGSGVLVVSFVYPAVSVWAVGVCSGEVSACVSVGSVLSLGLASVVS